jgi:hypothetical protein
MRTAIGTALVTAAVALLPVPPVRAAVERLEIVERTPFARGTQFGEAGAYEKIRGIAHFALDPLAPANARIADLKLAPRDARGRVTFESEFVLLRPVSARDSTLLYDVNNRGNIAILGQINGHRPADNDPSSVSDAGDGFLMRHGFTLLFSAWTWDVAPQGAGARPLVLRPPVARGADGAAITGPVANEFIVAAPAALAVYAGLLGLSYEPAIADDPAALLTERARPDVLVDEEVGDREVRIVDHERRVEREKARSVVGRVEAEAPPQQPRKRHDPRRDE